MRISSRNAVREALDCVELVSGDDPENRQLLQYLFSRDKSTIDWTDYLLEYRYDAEEEPQSDNLLFRWASRRSIHNLADLLQLNTYRAKMMAQPNKRGRLPIDAAITSGCLATFQLLSQYHSREETLKTAIDCRAADVVTYIVRSRTGTIFCDESKKRKTALHHATSTSNWEI